MSLITAAEPSLRLEPPGRPLVLELSGRLDLSGGRRLAELLHGVDVDGRAVEVRLPEADELPVTCLAACVLVARRARATGGTLRIVAGAGVARSVARYRLGWLLPVARA
jgi:hypothetical protein